MYMLRHPIKNKEFMTDNKFRAYCHVILFGWKIISKYDSDIK